MGGTAECNSVPAGAGFFYCNMLAKGVSCPHADWDYI